MILFIYACLFFSINTVLSNLISVQFTSVNQTVLLFDKRMANAHINLQIVRSQPHKCAMYFTLINNYTNAYLRYNHESDTSSCLLELNNQISLNVNVIQNKTLVLDLHTDQIDELKLNVEYIFKIFNDSEYGLINTDMKPNGIVAIVRIVYPKNDSIQLKITSFKEYFQVKMFLANFYMIRLSENTQKLFEQHDTTDLGLEAILLQSGESILAQTLKFKIVDQSQLRIKIPIENNECIKIAERSRNMGAYVTRVAPELNEKLFDKKNLKEFYLKSFIRMKIEPNSIEDDIFDLEPTSGHLAIRAGVSLDREFWAAKLKNNQVKFSVNISVFDTKKFFKSNSIQICVDLFDLNDNEPRYPKEEYDIDVYENQLNSFISMSIKDQKYYLVFNQSAYDFDHGQNSFLLYNMVNVKLNNKYLNNNFFLLEKKSGYLWLSSKIFDTKNLVNTLNIKIMVQDNAKFEFKYSYVNLNLKLVKNSFDVYKKELSTNRADKIDNYYFHVDLECLIQIGHLKIGYIYVKLINGSNMNIKLSEFYERFFNLTLGTDGSLSLSLNENFLNNKQQLKKLNCLEAFFMFSTIESKSKEIGIFIQFSTKQEAYFEEKNHYLYLNENLNTSLVAKLNAKCEDLDQARIIGFGHKFKVISKKNYVELWNVQELDAEIEQNIQFAVIAKCKKNEMDYLIWTNVTVQVNDLNDNYPIFVNPPSRGFTFYKVLTYSEIKKDQDVLLTFIQAFDPDMNSKGVKYSLNRTSLKISSTCQELFKLRLNLNKINGELSVSNLYTESSFRHCQFYYEIEISASDSKNVENLMFFIKIDVFGPDLVFYKRIGGNETTYRIEFDSINFFQIEQCWVNGLDADDLMSYFLSEYQLIFYSKNQSLNVKKFECELSSHLFKSQHFVPWLMIEFEQDQNYSYLASQYFDVNRSLLLTEDSFILNLKNLSQSDQEGVLKIFSLVNTTDETWRTFFSLNSFSGDLKTRPELEKYLEAVQIVDLINLDVEIKTFIIGYNNRLMNTQMVRIYLNVLDKQYTRSIDQLVEDYNYKFINITINYINQTSDLKLIDFGDKILNQQNNHLEITLDSVIETNLVDTNQIIETNVNLFKVIEYENKLFLVFNSLLVKKKEIFTNFRLYSLTLDICSKEIFKLNSFSRDCSSINLFIKISFELDQNYLVFSSKTLHISVIKLGDVFYGQDLEIISPNKPLVDLKTKITGSNLIDWESDRKIKFKVFSDVSNSLMLNEQDGLLYANNLNILAANLTCKVKISYLDKIVSSLTIIFEKIEISTNLVRNITLSQESHELWYPILNFNLTKINQATLKNIEFVKRCENFEQILCDRLFRIEPSDGSLTINKSLAFSHRIEWAKVYIQTYLLSQMIANYETLFNFFYSDNFSSLPLIDSNLVNFINSSEVKHRIFILNKQKLDHDVYLDLERVKNLNSNSLVLALDYRLHVDKWENYYIEIPFAFAIEPNQLYSFDFVARYRINGSLVESFLKQSMYVIRLGSPVLFTGPKKYFNTAGEKKFKISLREFLNSDEKKFDLWQTKFLINHISTSGKNLIPCTTLDSYYLDLDLDNRNIGPVIVLKLNKFVIDKLSLEIIKVYEYDVLIETFDWNLKKPSVHELIKTYFINIMVLKSEIINQSTDNPYDFLIYKIDSNQKNLIEYSIVYNENIPFEIGKYTGELYYQPSEDQKNFNSFYEKDYNFQITATDLNGQTAQIIVQFKLFDDDPISYLGNKLNQIIEVKGNLTEGQIIGNIDVKNALEKNIHKNFSELISTLSQWKIDYSLKNSDKKFSINSKTGLIMANNFIEEKDQKFYQLNIEVNSKFREKAVLLEMYVYVVFENKKILKQENFEFEKKNFKFITNNSSNEFVLETKQSTKNMMDRRFRIIDQNGLNCQINSLTGIVYCQYDENKKINFYVILFNSKFLNYFDLARVEVKFLNKISTIQPTAMSKGIFDMQFNLEYLPKIGELIVNIFELIKQKYNLTIDFDQHRLFLISNNSNSDSIQFYFNLNSVNGDLVLKNRILNFKTNISQYLKLVSKSLDYYQIFKLSIMIKLDRISGCWNSFTYSNLIKTNTDLIQIGSVYQSQDNAKYYLENSKLIKTISNNLVLYEKVEFTPNKDSIIFVDSLSGTLSLNKTKLIEKNLIKFEFFISSIKFAANLNNIQNRYVCRFGLDFEKRLGDILKFIGTSKISIDIIIDVNQLSIGDTIFNIRDLLSKSDELFNPSFKLVSDFEVPFRINEKNGHILLDSHDWFKNQCIKILIQIDSTFELEIKFYPQSIPRSIYFDQDVCHRNSTLSRNNNFLNFKNSVYKLKIGLDDFNVNRPILSLSTTNMEKNIIFKFVNNQKGMAKFFTSLLKLNELNGQISKKTNEYKNFVDFCTYYSALPVNILINVKAFNAEDSNIFGHAVIQIEPNCDLNFINSKFSQPFYFIKISKEHKIGNLLTQVNVNLKNYEIRYTLCNNDETLVRIDETTGHVYLNRKLKKKRYQIGICALIVNSMISKPIKVETKLIILAEENLKISTIGLEGFGLIKEKKFNLRFYAQKEIFNLKMNLIHFEKSKNIRLLSSSPGLFSLNSSTGWLIVNHLSANSFSSKLHHLKFFVSESEIFDFKIKFKETILDLSISRTCKIGSIVLDLKKKFHDFYKFIVLSSEYENFLNYDQTNGIVYLTKYPANVDDQFLYYAKFGSTESHFYVLKLRIKFSNFLFTNSILPNSLIYRNLNQDSNYFFAYSIKLFEHNFALVGKILEKTSIESQGCLNNNKIGLDLFSLRESGQVYINNSRILEIDCDLFEINTRLFTDKKATIYVQIKNFFELKYLNMTSIFANDYSTILVTDLLQREFYTINIYDLIKYKQNLNRLFEEQFILVSDTKLINNFSFDSTNGLLSLNLRKNVSNGTHLIEFQLILKKEIFIKILNVKIFVLNGFISGNEYFFNFDLPEKELVGNDELNLLEFLQNPISGQRIKTLRNSGLSLLIENHEPFEFDSMSGSIRVSRKIQHNFSRLAEFSACLLNFCQKTKLKLNYRPDRINWFDQVKKYYQQFRPNIEIDLNFKNLNPFLFKLKTFTNSLDYFKVNTNNVMIEPGTGLVFLNQLKNNIEKFYFLILNNSSVLAEFSISFLPKEKKSDNNQIQIEVSRTEGKNLNAIYLGNLNQKSLKCQNWDGEANFRVDNDCNAYFVGNSSSQTIKDYIIRVYDPISQSKSKFLSIKMFSKISKIYSKKYLIEFKYVRSCCGEKTKAELYKFLKSKFIFDLLDIENFEHTKSLVFLISSLVNIQILQQYKQYVENKFLIKISNVYEQNSPYKIIKSDSDDRKNLIADQNFILNVDSNYEIFSSPDIKFKNSIQFEKFSFQFKKNLNFSIQNFIKFQIWFKIEGEQVEQFLFSSIIQDKLITCELFKDGIRIYHNLSGPDKIIVLTDQIAFAQWYQLEILINTGAVFSLKKWQINQNMFQLVDTSSNNNLSIDRFFINELYFGGLPVNSTSFPHVNTYYSDQLSFSRFQINDIDHLESIIHKNICTGGKNFFKISQNYKNFLDSEEYLLKNKIARVNTFTKGLNLTVKFQISRNKSSIYELVKSHKSEIIIDLDRKRVEYYILNNLISSIDLSTLKTVNKLELFVKPGLVKLDLNGLVRETSFSNKNLNFDLFKSDLILSDFILYHEILINSMNFDQFYFNSNVEISEKKTPKLNINVSTYTNSDSSYKPSLILIIILCSMIIAFMAVLSILMLILVQKRRFKSNINFSESKFNSRNPLEISVNSSTQNSPISSNSDFTSSLETQTNPVTSRISQQNYFEYDTSLSKNASIPFFNSFLAKSSMDSSSFDQSDFEQLKNFLNWTPDIYQFSSLLNEFEKFSNHNHVCSINSKNNFFNSINLNSGSTTNDDNILGSLNLYEEYDKQTFV